MTQHLDADQTYRYAEASGDNMPIHLDAEVAKSVGPARDHHPRPLHDGVHVVGCDPRAVRRRLHGWRGSRCASRARCSPARTSPPRSGLRGDSTGNPAFGFETRNGDGEVVIKDGLVEVAG